MEKQYEAPELMLIGQAVEVVLGSGMSGSDGFIGQSARISNSSKTRSSTQTDSGVGFGLLADFKSAGRIRLRPAAGSETAPQAASVGDNCAYVKRGVLILLACCRYASALNPSLDVNQYAHNAWTIRDGFFKGMIDVNCPDARRLSLARHGIRLASLRWRSERPMAAAGGEHLPSSYIRSLLAARDGRLWIGTEKGLASWKDGKLTHYPELAGRVVSLLEDREGTIWAGGSGVPPETLRDSRRGAQCYGEDGRFGRGVFSLYEDKAGNLWAGADDRALAMEARSSEILPDAGPAQWPDRRRQWRTIDRDRASESGNS